MAWAMSSLQGVLANTLYRGLVVPADVFDAVQGIVNPPVNRTPKYPFPLRGAVRCSCGRLLSVMYSGVKNRKRYYICRMPMFHKYYPMHDADALEKQFVQLLYVVRHHPELDGDGNDSLDALRARQEALKKEIAGLESRKNAAWRLAEDGDIGAADLKNRITEIGTDQHRLEAELGEVAATIRTALAVQSSRDTIASALDEMAHVWEIGSVEDRRETARLVADFCGGLYVEPPPRRRTTESRLLARRPIPGFNDSTK
jgi:hypothetical protein